MGDSNLEKPKNRQIDWAEYSAQMRLRARDSYISTAAKLPQRSVRRRPRTPEEQRILTELCLTNWHKALESGALTKVGPRQYRLQITMDTNRTW